MHVQTHRCLAVSIALLVGCSDSAMPPDLTNAPSIEVLYDRQPLADVNVQLRQTTDGEIVAQAITGDDGKARFDEVPASEPAQYIVTAESFSDGGWMLDPKYSQPKTSQLIARPLATHQDQKIELPPNALRMLDPARRR